MNIFFSFPIPFSGVSLLTLQLTPLYMVSLTLSHSLGVRYSFIPLLYSRVHPASVRYAMPRTGTHGRRTFVIDAYTHEINIKEANGGAS